MAVAERLKGIVCLEDVKSIPRNTWETTPVGEIMTPKERLKSAAPETDGRVVLKTLTDKDVHQVPVVEGDRIVGIICRSDILRYIRLRSELGE